MRVRIMEEYGFAAAMFGLGFSYGRTSDFDYPENPLEETLYNRACKLASMGKGHNKFLRQIMLWIDCDAPLYWWKQFDQYKVATCTQSESTMHTLGKQQIQSWHFEKGLPTSTLFRLNSLKEAGDFDALNRELPQSFLQRRVITMSYETLRAIVEQRTGHKLVEWKYFIDHMLEFVAYPEFLCK